MSQVQPEDTPQGLRRVTERLSEVNHPHAPVWLDVAVRTSQEAATALGVQVGQIAKSVVFRRRSDAAAVLIVTSGDRRVDEARVAARLGALARADADFIKQRTGFSIGGVAPLAHLSAPVTLVDRELFRFAVIWAAAGHPNAVFQASPHQLLGLTGAPVADVTEAMRLTPAVPSPCTDVCRMDPRTGWCEGCSRTIEEIAQWASLDDAAKRAVWACLAQRREQIAASAGARPPGAPR